MSIGRPRLQYLDGLRGVAIIGVVQIHVGQVFGDHLPKAVSNWMLYGYRGVQLFFVVSAITLFNVYFGRKIRVGEFALKRFLRIAPMFYMAIVAYAWIWPSHPSTIFDVLLTFLFVHGYSVSAINSVVPGGWSIASEATFYLLFPALILWATTLERATVLLFGFIAMALVTRLIAPILFRGNDPIAVSEFVHFSFLNNAPAFACGIVVYHAMSRTHIAAPIALLGLLASICVLTAIGMAGLNGLQNVWLASLLLAAMTYCAAVLGGSVFNSRWLGYIGEVSFSVYLWHFLVIGGLERVYSPVDLPVLVGLPLFFGLVFSISLVLASLTYFFVEKPIVSWGKYLIAKSTPRSYFN